MADSNKTAEVTGKAASAIPYLGLITAAIGLAGSIINGFQQRKTNKELMQFNQQEAQKQRQWTEVQTANQNAWNKQQWVEQNEYNSPEAQKERLADAGLNPMYYGIDGIPAASLTAAQPLGYERASLGQLTNPFGEAIKAALQIKEVQNSSKLANAQVDKINEETGGLKLDNEWKEKTMEARTQAEELKNSLTKEQIREIGSKIKVNDENAKKIAEEAKTEVERRGAIMAQKLLYQAQENEITTLLPYKKLLLEAETTAQKAAACASFAKAALDQKRLELGYVEAEIDRIVAETAKEAHAAAF